MWSSAKPQTVANIQTLYKMSTTLDKLLELKAKEIQAYIKKDAPRVIAKLATDHARESFSNQGYTDTTLEPWVDVKRRHIDNAAKGKNGKPLKKQAASYTRPILIGETRELKNSIRTIAQNDSVEIGSDKPYAEAHNWGTTTAGRNNKVTIPQRQFIGNSTQLRNWIKRKLTGDMRKILNS